MICFHKWSNWKDYKEKVHEDTGHTAILQIRECSKCVKKN